MNLNTKDKPAGNLGNTSTPGIGLLFRGIRRHPFIVLSSFLLSGMAASLVWFYLPLPKLTAYSTLQIKSQPDSIFRAEGDSKIDFNMYRQSQAAMIKNPTVLNLAMNQYDINGFIPDPANKVGWLERELKVDFKLGPELMRLSIEGNNEEQMLAIIAAVTNAYHTDVVNKDRAKRLARLNQLEKLYFESSENVKLKQQQLASLAVKFGSGQAAVLAEKEKHRHEMMGIWEKELLTQRRDLLITESEMKAQLERLSKRDKIKIPDEVVNSALLNDSGYLKLLDKKQSIQNLIQQFNATAVPGTVVPAQVAREKQLEEVNSEIATYVSKARPLIEAKIRDSSAQQDVLQMELLKRKHESLEALIARVKDEMSTLKKSEDTFNKDEFALHVLKSDLAQLEKQMDRYFQEMESIRPELKTEPRVVILEKATISQGIEGNRRLKFTLIAGLPLFVVGLALACFLEYRNRRVLCAAEVSNTLGLRVIGTVPRLPDRSFKKQNQSSKTLALQQHVVETVDNARAILLHGLDSSQSIRTIMVASALSGEGKSSLAGHLAVSFARAGFRTLLIDADMRRPCLHRVMGIPLQMGLSELIRGAANIDATIHPSPLANLSIIPAGLWDPSLPRVLAGNRWSELKAQLELEYDYIIVDSSPILPVADALLMARSVDGVLISLLREVSQLGAVSLAKERLERMGTNILGVVINGLDSDYYSKTYTYESSTKAGELSIA